MNSKNIGKYLLFLSTIIFTNVIYAYNPPVGIPEPGFGIDESIATTYGDANYYTHYIDNTHPAATDTNNPNGTASKPRKTIPTTFSAGNVVQVHGGPYAPQSGDRFYFNGYGTKTQPIIISGINATAPPVLTKKVHVSDARYLIIEGFKRQNISGATNTGGFVIRQLSTGITIQNISIRNCEIAGSKIFKSYTSYAVGSTLTNTLIKGIVFYKNTVYDNGIKESVLEDDTASFAIGHNVINAWVLENTGYNSGGDGIILAPSGANFTTHHIYIGGNTFYNHRENGIDLKEANDVVVSSNTIYGHRATATSTGEGIVVHYDPKRIWIINNNIYDSEYGIVFTGATDSYIIGNYLHDIKNTNADYNTKNIYKSSAPIHIRNSDSMLISNNTITNNDNGIQIVNGNIFDIDNNIFDNRSDAAGYDVMIESSTTASQTGLNNNLFNSQSGERIGWGSYNSSTISMLSQQYPDMSSNFTSKLLSVVDNNGSIIKKDQIADLGKSHASMRNYFKSLYNVELNLDFMKSKRIMGSSIDIGALEVNPPSSPPGIITN